MARKKTNSPAGDYSAQPLNREAWLTELARMIEPCFAGLVLQPYRLTCGWPSRQALGLSARRVGECHSSVTSKGGYHELFVSPLVEDPAEVAGIVAHEMAHVAAGVQAGHGKLFVKVCKHVGLTAGKPTQASPGPQLKLRLLKFIESLGAYPHSAIVPSLKPKKAGLKDVTLCCESCECRVRISAKWLDASGPPSCGCGAGPLSEPDE